jgi:hypothetical protein
VPLQLKIDQAKSFFFDRDKVIRDLDQRTHIGLSKFGAHVRQAVRSTLRKARMKKLSEMSKDERRLWKIRVEYAKRNGRPKPKRPLASSKPGEPPRMVLGYIRKFLYFAYEKAKRTVVIGPALINSPTGAPATLEKGGVARVRGRLVRIAPRPYMAPMWQEYYPQLPDYLLGAK